MPDLVVLYRLSDVDGRPVPVVSSADPELVAAVAKLLGAQLGLTPYSRTLTLGRKARPAAGGDDGRRARRPVWVPDLVATWRREAELLRAHGATEAAATKERDAAELECWLASYNNQALDLRDAAAESGFTASHLRRLVQQGVIENVGENGGTKLRRGDLPRKPRRQRRGPDLNAEVLGLPGGRR